GHGRAAQIRFGCLDAHHVPFHLAQRRIGAHGVAVDIERRRGVAVDRKARGPGRELRLDVEVDLADLVRGAGRGRCPGAVRVRPGEGAIRLPYPVTAGEVVALVRGELEQRVRLVDAVRSEAGEERAEGFVVVVQLLHVVSFAGPGGAGEVRVEGSGEGRGVVVVGVADVTEGHGHTGLLHLGDVAEGHLGGHPVEAGKTVLAERVLDLVAGRVVDPGVAAVDRGVDVLGAEQRLETEVAAGFVGQPVDARVGDVRGVGVADAAVDTAVDREADEVGQRLGARRGAAGSRVGGNGLVPLGRAGPEDAGHVAERSGAGVLEHDVGGRDRAVVTAGAGERHPWRRGVLWTACRRGDHVRQGVLDSGRV